VEKRDAPGEAPQLAPTYARCPHAPPTAGQPAGARLPAGLAAGPAAARSRGGRGADPAAGHDAGLRRGQRALLHPDRRGGGGRLRHRRRRRRSLVERVPAPGRCRRARLPRQPALHLGRLRRAGHPEGGAPVAPRSRASGLRQSAGRDDPRRQGRLALAGAPDPGADALRGGERSAVRARGAAAPGPAGSLSGAAGRLLRGPRPARDQRPAGGARGRLRAGLRPAGATPCLPVVEGGHALRQAGRRDGGERRRPGQGGVALSRGRRPGGSSPRRRVPPRVCRSQRWRRCAGWSNKRAPPSYA
jgi:hypothetical protein